MRRAGYRWRELYGRILISDELISSISMRYMPDVLPYMVGYLAGRTFKLRIPRQLCVMVGYPAVPATLKGM